MGFLKYLLKLVFQPPLKKKPAQRPSELNLSQVYTQQELAKLPVSRSLARNLEQMASILGHNIDFVKRNFTLGRQDPLPAAVCFLNGMIDSQILSSHIMRPLLEAGDKSGPHLLELLDRGGLISKAEIQKGENLQTVLSRVLVGEVVLFIDGYSRAFIISCKGYNGRSIPEPVQENTVRGPREAFVELLSSNISLLRKRLVTPNLVVENYRLGRISITNVALVYLKGLASADLVAEVRQRLTRIEIDAVLESGYLEQFIKDNPYSPFPQVITTERPDKVAADLLEGRVAILTDNTPFALVAPGQFLSLLQSSEDYYTDYYFATFVRWIRLVSLVLALTLPSLYIAVTNFHQEMIPTTLFISIAANRQGVPFPAVIEAITMELLFETLREASIRLPTTLAQTISIVGALVIGQAAVQANIVSPAMIIVVAATGIATFTLPQYSLGQTVRLLRFPLMLAAAFLGLFGLMTALLAILLHLCALRSFGVPYLSPLAPFNWQSFKDTMLVAPHWSRRRRPAEMVQANTNRLGQNLRPGPDKG
ncbi:spore germination protein [Desulforamulus hydrothermalis]|uniref:Spore germination protein KA n=1 Tax=Desulforamulus hydrothermalis Lam5 = DSM 18033 TaxID=1121428 RepID=K8EIW7_9FIRM|nr:spore germination protein [Desulforamulus hydrothermalis]CCO08556.1 Spore germination protein KA [Desulforamulus hydrothermalis Lam5 = DSM 18033]SHH02268.1 spore germination protein KA [Desulforamulus hydrothermalis Lam5 = DSM 18033]